VKNWYSIQAKTTAPAEISIYDEIGLWGVTAMQFIADLKAIDAQQIRLFINSPGGSVFDALAMYNALRQHPAEIEVVVMGVAASAASIVAMAGNKIVMPENAFMMIHNPLNMAYGNADELREMADVLDKIAASLIATYAARTGLPDEEIKTLLDAETWLSAAEAVEKGFADELQPALKVAACYDAARLPDNVQAAIIEPPAAPIIEPPTDTVVIQARALVGSIVAKASAAGLAAHADAFLLDDSIKNEADADAAIAEAGEVLAVCRAAKLPDMAVPLIKARVPLASVRARLIEARAALDQSIQIDNHIPQPKGAPQPSAISIAGIYAARRPSV